MEDSIRKALETGSRLPEGRLPAPEGIRVWSAPPHTPGPPDPRDCPHPLCWDPEGPSLSIAQTAPFPPAKWHFKEQWQLTEGVKLDPPM